MPVIGATSAVPPAGVIGGAADTALGGLGGDAFLKLLVAQLRYQNPLEPQDQSQLMLQTAQLTQLENIQQMVTLQRRDLGMQEATMAAGLVGSDVTAALPGGGEVSGPVDGVRYTAAGPVLEVAGAEVTLGAVTEIRRSGAPPAATPVAPDTVA